MLVMCLASVLACYTLHMTIVISWEWALGLSVTLIGAIATIAWKGSARFTAIETSMGWIEKTLNDLKTSFDNRNLPSPAFQNQSPVSLTQTGQNWLEESGLKAYIDANPQKFQDACSEKKDSNPYEVQKHAFDLFDKVRIEDLVEEKLKRFAFEKGISMSVMRRIGGIYLRNICLEKFKMNAQDIDKHDPEKPAN